MGDNKFSTSGPVWNKYFPKFRGWVFFVAVSTMLLYALLYVFYYSMPTPRGYYDIKTFYSLRVKFGVLVLISIVEVLLVLLAQRRIRVVGVAVLRYINTFAVIMVYVILKEMIGSHATIYEGLIYKVVLWELIVQFFASVGLSNALYQIVEIKETDE